MIKILLVCHGNICRSPMAEFIMKDLVQKAGLAAKFHIESAATSREEIGNPVYPPARRKLAEHGISCAGHAARGVELAFKTRWHGRHTGRVPQGCGARGRTAGGGPAG